MGFGDKLKDLRKQAQEAVSEHSEQLHTALDVAGTAANTKTRGKHTQRIAKFGEKASEKLDKFAAGSEDEEGAAAEAGAPEAAAPAGDPSAGAAEEPAASAEPETSAPPPPPAPSSPPPAANPDLAAWAAGDDSASQ
jgi:MT0933-like antitoxin protein